MQLASFRIRNFKSVVDSGVCRLNEGDNILVLAGQNEAGKSAVTEALDFFGNGPSADFERLHRRKEENPEVECEFILSDGDVQNVYIESQNERLRDELQKTPRLSFIRRATTEGKLDEIFFTDESEQRLTPFFESVRVNEVPQAAAVEPTDAIPAETASVPTSVPESAPYSLKDLTEFLFGEMRQFVYYKAFDALLPGITTVADIPKYPAVSDFEKVFGVKFAKIVQKDVRGIHREEMTLNRKASDDLNTYWTQKLEKNGKYNFEVKIIRKDPVETSTVEFMIDRGDEDPLYLEQKSTGFRWFSAFNLKLRALGVEESTIRNIVVLIDEPGQGLHEKAQRDLKKVMEELGTKGAQIIYTTHYPNLIGTIGKEFARIRLVSNTNGVGTLVQTVAQFASRPDVGAGDALSPLITAMGIQSVGTLLDQTRLNVLVEGITDHYYLSALRILLGKSDRYFFIPACGVSNIPHLASVLIGWGLNFNAVFDDDPDAGRKAYNLLKREFYEDNDEQAHEHILKIRGCDGIEDIFSSRDFHKFVLDQKYPTTGTPPKNSTLANGRKEVLARLFLEKAVAGSVTLDRQTTASANEVFEWLKSKFKI